MLILRRLALGLGGLLVVVGGYYVGREIVRPPLPAAAALPASAVVPEPAAAAEPTGLEGADEPIAESRVEAPSGAEERIERDRRRPRLGADERLARRRELRRERGLGLEGRRQRAGFPGRLAESSSRGDASMALAEAIREHASGPWVEGHGTVERVMRDDLRGRQHQRFVLALDSGETLLVAHNTQLAGRAPVEVGETIRFRGRYEWNARGGIVHWTHRDPRGGSGGWLELAGQRYE